ncbi:MAG: hypothetical protein QOJ97_196 [Solirubrobacteraceae bacterium]|jgi:hypothetical protein|nr:hypothetical protein [Solirubrobacteraceae bacterium]
MADQRTQDATNERILRSLDEVKAQLAESKRREELIAKNLDRLLARI